ncbi:MAG: hypothetical protein JSS60_00295 [Verrucomicrobia bacterium]|nr:hypothetical protein [Verrucomicrobiota bacterium]
MSFQAGLQLDHAERYRAAVKSCQYLYRAINCLYGSISPLIIAATPKSNEEAPPVLLNKIHLINHAFLQQDTTLTREQKCDISAAYRKLANDYLTNTIPFIQGFARYAGYDLNENYFKVIQSPEVDQIAMTAGGIAALQDSEVYNRDYVQQHHEVYQNFIPRIAELRDWMVSSSQKYEENAMLLRYIPLYLRLADLNVLKMRLEQPHSSAKFTEIFFDEVKRFALQCKSDKKMVMKVLKVLRDPDHKPLACGYQSLSCDEVLFSGFRCHSEILLDGPLSTAERFSRDLFYQAPLTLPKTTAPSMQQRPKKKDFPEAKVLQVKETADPVPDPVVEVKAPLKPETQVVSKQPVPYERRLQNLKGRMSACLSFLQRDCKGFGTVEALENVQVHWDGLLCTMKRFLDSEKAVSDPQLFSFMTDIVRESALAMEQTLSALDRSSNELKSQDELKEHLSHDLVQVLMSCKLKNGPLSQRYRNWIHQMNRGEILTRDFRDCAINGTSVEKLLTKARLTAEGNPAFSRSEVLADVFDYFKKACLICIQLQRPIAAANPGVKAEFQSQLGALEKELREFCKETKSLLPSLEVKDANHSAIPEESLAPELRGIRQAVAEMRSLVPYQEVRRGLDNLLQNVCLQLEVEMQAHEFLEPVEAYHHMSKIFLLNQTIAEQFLVNLCDAFQIPYDLEEIDHDLAKLVGSLGMSQADFTKSEWSFLVEGKMIRFLARYPASYTCVYLGKRKGNAPRVEKSIQNAIAFSHSEIFEKGNQIKEGFQSTKKKMPGQLLEIKTIVEEDIATLASILGKISAKKLPELKI